VYRKLILQEPSMTEINGTAALITGGGTGIGRGLAQELANQGATVAVADIMIDNARAVAAEINAGGGKALALHCDVCERA
jgi:NAD(P)-dependent dehydrogenase (short-subunit alcohol dehydrogenase family)